MSILLGYPKIDDFLQVIFRDILRFSVLIFPLLVEIFKYGLYTFDSSISSRGPSRSIKFELSGSSMVDPGDLKSPCNTFLNIRQKQS